MSDSDVHAVVELDGARWGPLAFGAPRAVIEAREPGEVVPALRAVEAAARGGRWAVGAIAAEAAPAFDPALRVRGGDASGRPLVWFGLHDGPLGAPPAAAAGEASLHGLRPELEEREHAAAVARLRAAIAAGVAYQVNLTLRWRGRFEGEPLALYQRLRRAQGGGQTVFLRLPGRALVSASPELFLARDGTTVATRPMKGTARRGRWEEEDEAVRAALLASAKDRAENVMIVDLLRNDLGRVAELGGVRVGCLLEAERYRTVWQLTSTVEAAVPRETTLAALLSATFPCGSVTGAPKASAMGLIAAEERSPRGFYCGAAGAVAPGGDARLNVAIRTVELDLAAGTATYGTGGGVTWGSDARAEWEEALAKAAVLQVDPEPPTLLETLRVEGGRIALLDRHLARLASSARHHGIAVDLAAVRRMLESLQGDARVRLLVPPLGAPRLERGPLPPAPTGPVRVAFARRPVDSRDPALFHKTVRRAPYDERRAERPDCFDVLLTNEHGRATELGTGSLVAELDGLRFTPPLGEGLLPGVARAELLARGIVRERPLSRADVERAARLWLANAVRGLMECRLVA